MMDVIQKGHHLTLTPIGMPTRWQDSAEKMHALSGKGTDWSDVCQLQQRSEPSVSVKCKGRLKGTASIHKNADTMKPRHSVTLKSLHITPV